MRNVTAIETLIKTWKLWLCSVHVQLQLCVEASKTVDE